MCTFASCTTAKFMRSIPRIWRSQSRRVAITASTSIRTGIQPSLRFGRARAKPPGRDRRSRCAQASRRGLPGGLRWRIRPWMHRDVTASMTGARCAISAKTSPPRRSTLRRAWLEPAIWMNTEAGGTLLNMEMCGYRVMSRQDGRHIATDSGSGKRLGDGLGWTRLLGDLLRSITAAGWILAPIGDGRQDLTGPDLTMLRRWWPGLAGRTSGLGLTLDLALALAADLAGVRWGLASRSSRGMGLAAVISAM